MKEHTPHRQTMPRTLDACPKASRQASLEELLQSSLRSQPMQVAGLSNLSTSVAQFKSPFENMLDLLRKLFKPTDISPDYVKEVMDLLQKIREIDLSFLAATTYEMMDNATHDLPQTEKEPRKKLVELKLQYIRRLLASGIRHEAYRKQLEEQQSILESLQSNNRFEVNPNVLLSPDPKTIRGYMAILGPGREGNTPRKDLVEDELRHITPVSDKLQIGFNTPVRAFSWYTLYLLKDRKKEPLPPPTAPLIRTFGLPWEEFIRLSKLQIEESKLKSASGLPNAEDIKIPNQMGFPSGALKGFDPQNLITYFSSGDYGKSLLESISTQGIDAFKQEIGFGQYREQDSGKEAAFIPSPIHFFDHEHTAFHQGKKGEEGIKWEAYGYIDAVRQLIIFTTFFDAISIYLQTGELLETPALIIPEEIQERVPEEILKGIKMPQDTSSMLRSMLDANQSTWNDYQAMQDQAVDRRGNKKSSLEAEDGLATALIATVSEHILPFGKMSFVSEQLANEQLAALKSKCLKSKDLEDCKKWAESIAQKTNQPENTIEKIKKTPTIVEIKKLIQPIPLPPQTKKLSPYLQDIALKNAFFLLKECIIEYLTDYAGENAGKKRMLTFFQQKSEFLDFMADSKTYFYLNCILSMPIKNPAVRDMAVKLKFHAFNFFFRLLRIVKDFYPSDTKPQTGVNSSIAPTADVQTTASPEIKVERDELDSPYARLNPESRELKAGRAGLHVPFDRNRSQVVYTRPDHLSDTTIYEKLETPFMGGVSGTTRDITQKVIHTFPCDAEGEKAYWKFQLYNAAFMIANRFHSFLEVMYPAALWGNARFASQVPNGISAGILTYLQGLSSDASTPHAEVLRHIWALIEPESDFPTLSDTPLRPGTSPLATDTSEKSEQPEENSTGGVFSSPSSSPAQAGSPSVPGEASGIPPVSYTTYPIASSQSPEQPAALPDRQLAVYPTVGDGNCGIHALLGTLQLPGNEYRLEDTPAVRQRLFEYMGEKRVDLRERYAASITDLLSEIESRRKAGKPLTPLEISHLTYFKKHMGNLEEKMDALTNAWKDYSADLITKRDNLVEEIEQFILNERDKAPSVLDYLVSSVSNSETEKDKPIRSQLRSKSSEEEQRTVICQSDRLTKWIVEDLDQVLARLENVELNSLTPYREVQGSPSPSMGDLVQDNLDALYDGYRDQVKENGYFLRQEDMLTLADKEGVGLVIYILSDRQDGKVVEAVSHETGRATVRRVFHYMIHYQHAELRETATGPLAVDTSEVTLPPAAGDTIRSKEDTPSDKEALWEPATFSEDTKSSKDSTSSEDRLPEDRTASVVSINAWEDRTVKAGQIVFHGTYADSAQSIKTEGIRLGKDGYGSDGSGGELGRGFYVTTDKNMAKTYADGKAENTKKQSVILCFKVKKEVKGKIVPSANLWHISSPLPQAVDFLCTNNDYCFPKASGLLELIAEK